MAITIPISTSGAIIGQLLLGIPSIYFLILFFKENNFKDINRSLWPLLVLAFSLTLSTILNLDINKYPPDSYSKIRYLYLACLGYFSFFHLVRKEDTQQLLARLIHIFYIVLMIEIIVSYICVWIDYDIWRFKPRDYRGRVGGSKGYMQFGYETPMLAIIALSLRLNIDKLKIKLNKNIMTMAAIVVPLGAFFSQTRGGMLGLLAGLPFLLYFYRKKYGQVAFIAGFLFAALMVFAWMSGGIPQLGRLFSKFNNTSNNERMIVYKESIKAAKQRPWFGVGVYNEVPDSKVYFGESANPLNDTHSTILQFLVSGGIIGFLLYHLFLFLWLKESSLWIVLPFMVTYYVSSLVHSMFITGTSTAVIIFLFYLITINFTKRE